MSSHTYARVAKTISIGALVTGSIVFGSAAAWANSTGWNDNNLARSLATVDGCPVEFWGTVTTAEARENPSCPGNIGIQARYRLYSGSLIYTSNIECGASYTSVTAPLVLQNKVHH